MSGGASGGELFIGGRWIAGGGPALRSRDPASGEVLHKIAFEVPGIQSEFLQPVGVRVTGDGARVFVALGPSNRVAVVDGATWEVLDYLLVGQRVWQLAFTPDERYLISTNGNSNDVSVIDVEALEVIRSVPVGQQPWGVVVAPQ